MMSTYDYDLFVIGTGDAGTSAAIMCASAGWHVGIVDELPFGGTCALRGCNPKRVLAGATELLYRTNGMKGRGITGDLSIDWGDLIKYKEEVISGIPQFREASFLNMDIDMYHGFASFASPHEIKIGNKKISFKQALIASGSKPRKLNIPGENYCITSDKLLELQKLPQHVLFIGGGYISIEFARVLAAAGSQVTILELLSTPLGRFDTELVSLLLSEMKKQGVTIQTNVKVLGVEKTINELLVITEGNNNFLFKTDMVVNGAGRIPNVEQLMLDNAEIVADASRIRVNEFLQSVSNSSIYIAGDAHSGGIQLTPVAEMEGYIAAYNLMNGNVKKPDYSFIPSVAFTFPEIGTVGEVNLPAEQLITTEIIFHNTSSKKITQRLGLDVSAFKILIDKESRKIKGAHLLGYNIDEVINFFALAMQHKCTIDEVKGKLWAFPSVTYDTLFRI